MHRLGIRIDGIIIRGRFERSLAMHVSFNWSWRKRQWHSRTSTNGIPRSIEHLVYDSAHRLTGTAGAFHRNFMYFRLRLFPLPLLSLAAAAASAAVWHFNCISKEKERISPKSEHRVFGALRLPCHRHDDKNMKGLPTELLFHLNIATATTTTATSQTATANISCIFCSCFLLSLA